MKKSCSKCKEEKPMDGFYRESKKKDGRKNVCKDCCNIVQKLSRDNPEYRAYKKNMDSKYIKKNKDNPEYRLRRKRARVKNLYGITLEEYDAYLETPCCICGDESKVLDHCHITGKNRGGLCQACNKMLGCARDNIDTLNRAIMYLEESKREFDK